LMLCRSASTSASVIGAFTQPTQSFGPRTGGACSHASLAPRSRRLDHNQSKAPATSPARRGLRSMSRGRSADARLAGWERHGFRSIAAPVEKC
jgi:hypothetical protein